jgi:phosphoesterase RecJ-like protein
MVVAGSAFVTREVAQRMLGQSHRPLLMGHVEIDGDALGSAVALVRGFRALGREPVLALHEPAPRIFDFLLAAGEACVVRDLQQAQAVLSQRDLVVVLDNNSWERLGCFGPLLRDSAVPVLCIDHHPCAEAFSEHHYLDTSAAATGVLVQELLEGLGWPMDERAADALYAATVNDTGWFRWSNTDQRALMAAARLVVAGARPDRVAASIMLRESLAAKRLLARFLDTIELTHGGQVATGFVSREMFAATGATREDSEDLVNHLRAIADIQVAIFLREDDAGVKLSFRTRAPHSARALALRCDGGGHEQAAGGRHAGPLSQALVDVRQWAAEMLTRSQQRG